MLLSAIIWDVDPAISPWLERTLGFSPRWYGLLFAAGFIIGYIIMQRIYKRENKPLEDLDSLLMHIIVGTVVGARLGHVLFYEPGQYLMEPWRILFIWEGGLASHGGAIGVLYAIYRYSRKRKGQPFLYVVDRIVITVALEGFFIRLGNLFNSEIFGGPTDLPWGFVFVRRGLTVPHHPTQLYEAFSYLLIFFLLFALYKRMRVRTPHGFLLGMFLVLVFGARFLIEFIKLDQVGFEATLPINMGQILSLPFIAIGAWLIYRVRGQLGPAMKPEAEASS